MSVKIAEQSDEPKCSKCRKLMAEYFARTRLSLAFCPDTLPRPALHRLSLIYKDLDTEMTSVQHLLSFVTNQDGSMVTIHADLPGIEILIRELESLRDAIAGDDCPHTHLFSTEAVGKELSTSKLDNQPAEVNNVCHVKIYGWNSEWAVRHGLRCANAQNP